MSIEPFLASHPRTWLTMKVSYPLSSREWTFVGAPSETVEEREWRKRVTTGVAQSGNVSYQDGGTSSWQEARGQGGSD